MNLIAEAGKILNGAADLIKDPILGSAVGSVFSWVKQHLTKSSQKEKLDKVENNEHDAETIIALKTHLELLLEDNEELQNQLTEKIETIQTLLKENDKPADYLNKYEATIKGDGNVIIQGSQIGGSFNNGK